MAGGPDSVGILATGAYLPRWRIARQTIADAMGWSRGRTRPASGDRSFCNWDEDALTLSVEAGRAALAAADASPDALELASTSLPFADRHHAGVAREALRLADDLALSETGGSRRCATSALIRALTEDAGATRLLAAGECVDTQAGSEAEPAVGHGAAAVVTGPGETQAILLAAASRHDDFVDQYRAADQAFDYRLEARWVRDAGIRPLLVALVRQVLDQAGLEADSVQHWLLPFDAGTRRALYRDLGVDAGDPAGGLESEVGHCGAAQPLLLLHRALAVARRGEHIVLVGAGQGFDVLVLKVQADGRAAAPAPILREDNYTRYLGLRGLLAVDGGIRGERDNRSSLSATHRRHAELNGFLAGRCGDCDRLQFPLSAVCVHCQARDAQTPESLADRIGEINSFTEDWLAYTPRPPLVFGNIHFPGGANVLMEFTDVLPGELAAGQAVHMAFRIKDLDARRGYRRYFWKPVPVRKTEADRG